MIRIRHDATGLEVWTVGHSSRSADELLESLRAFAIGVLADVRRRPASRRHPHFNRVALSHAMAEAGVAYAAMHALGGFRGEAAPSRHAVLELPAFRAYADYMAGGEFAQHIDALLARAWTAPTAMMCAERDWRACHRSLIADYLHACGARVIHIDAAGRSEAHALTAGARAEGGWLDYEGAQRSLL